MEPFRFFTTLNIPQNNQGAITNFTVPANRLLRIEFIAGDVTLPAGESDFIAVSIQTHDSSGSTTGLFSINSRKDGNIGVLDLFEIGQVVSIYADSETTVSAQVNRFGSGTLGSGGINISVAGQLFT